MIEKRYPYCKPKRYSASELALQRCPCCGANMQELKTTGKDCFWCGDKLIKDGDKIVCQGCGKEYPRWCLYDNQR